MARRLSVLLLALVAAVAVIAPGRAVEPDEVLSDPALEARARDISAGLRCLVCQNQSIDDSHAPLARDLRKLVRERLVAGDSDQAVRDYIVQRYGDFVLLKPPLNLGTALLWLAPLLLLVGAVALAFRQLHPAAPSRSASGGEPPLSADEKRRLDEILKRDG
jgi:cytochrome c-type biogenesis protein CcmH